MKIFIVFTNHANQMIGCEHGDAFNFIDYLSNICLNKNIDLIAEELSEEALASSHAIDSSCRILSGKMGIRHIFCDPESAERKFLGIPSESEILEDLGFGKVLTRAQAIQLKTEEMRYWNARENYWIENIIQHDFKRCLFICGSSHIGSFSKNLSSKGINFEIITENWIPPGVILKA